MEKILEMLGIDKLDESKQNEIKEKFDEIVQVKVDEKVVEQKEETKTQLTEEYEKKFEDYKNDLTEKFSGFVDEVLDEEMQIPDKVKEFARKGELYEEVIETLKTRMAIDEGHVDEEVKELLNECKTEITSLKEKTNDLTSENMNLKKDAREFAASLYLREKAEGLGIKEKEKVFSILEGITDKEKIDSKFDIIVESLKSDGEKTYDGEGKVDEKGKGQEDPETKVDEGKTKDPFEDMMGFWSTMLSESK